MRTATSSHRSIEAAVSSLLSVPPNHHTFKADDEDDDGAAVLVGKFSVLGVHDTVSWNRGLFCEVGMRKHDENHGIVQRITTMNPNRLCLELQLFKLFIIAMDMYGYSVVLVYSFRRKFVNRKGHVGEGMPERTSRLTIG
jgi:hypothetical protein